MDLELRDPCLSQYDNRSKAYFILTNFTHATGDAFTRNTNKSKKFPTLIESFSVNLNSTYFPSI